MLALPGVLALLLFDFLRPQEYLPALRGLPLLHSAAAFAALGFIVDLRLGVSRLRAAPHLALTVLLFLWCVVTVAVRGPGLVPGRVTALLIPLVIYLVVAHCLQSFRALEITGGFLLAISLALAAIGVHQGLSPYGCHRLESREGDPLYLFDGRPCERRVDCEGESAEPGARYACEKVGLLDTSSINGRVRFRGTMEDPNELSLALGIAIPIAFAFYDRRRSPARLGLVVVTGVLAGLCAIFTMSRGGQLVFLTVLGAYFIRQVGWKRGVATGLALALPLLLLGGRSGAEESTMERIQCWWVGLRLFAGSPTVGVGSGQFMEYHHQTAHNTFVLAAAELGAPGLILWSAIVYLSIKVLVAALRAPVAPVARAWATALLASMAGLVVGIMFLSYLYKEVLWIYVALTGVLYQAIRRHEPAFGVGFGARDLGFVALGDAVLLVAHVGYTGTKLGW